MMHFGLNRFRRYKVTAAASFATASTTSSDILSQSFEAKGGGVFLSLYYNSATSFPIFYQPITSTPGGFTIEFCRDDVVFHAITVRIGKTEAGAGSYIYSPTEFWAIDRAVGGTYVYKARAKVSASGESLEVNCKLLVAQGML